MMQLISIEQCSISWDFLPTQRWPEGLPAVSWRGKVLAGFNSPTGLALEMDGDFIQAIKAAYQELTFAELARLWAKSKGEISETEWASIFATFQFRFDGNCRKTAEKLVETPTEFQIWCSEKVMGVRDLACLRSIDSTTELQEICKTIAEGKFSKSTGAQCLELAIELTLLNQPLPTFTGNAEKWLTELRDRRYQRGKSADLEFEHRLRQLPWPLHSNSKWLRQGDRAGIHFQFLATNQVEFEKQVQGLKQVSELLQKEPQRLWKN